MIHVVVSCAERKCHPVETGFAVSGITQQTFQGRLKKWLQTVAAAQSGHKVIDLYQGEHWSVARSIPNAWVSVWTASAGFGLLSLEDTIPSYNATFSAQNANSVSRVRKTTARQTELSEWWSALQTRADRPRTDTLASLIADGPVIIAASQPYLQAMHGEIVDAHARAIHALVISTVGTVPSNLAHLRLPCDGRIRNVLGGSMGATSVRLAKELAKIPEDKFTRESAVVCTERLMTGCAPLQRFHRQPLSDDEVMEFIQSRRVDTPSISASRLLRELRDEGMACEQSRFGRLFAAAGIKQ